MNKVERYIKACHTSLKTTPECYKNRPIYGRVPVNYALMQDLSVDIMVHLHGNCLWSTLHENFSHDQMAAKCNFHLAYLGQGIHAELVKREPPLQSCSESDDMTSLIISTLNAEGYHTINKLVYLGLGVGIDNTDRPKKCQ